MSGLRGLARKVLDETALVDPHEVAAEMMRRLRGGPAVRAALAEALPVWVRASFTRDRLLPSSGARVASGGHVGSARVAAVRASGWARRIETPIFVGADWKLLAACTAEDLGVVAASLLAQSKALAGKADYYLALAAALPPGGVVGDLDADPTEVAA